MSDPYVRYDYAWKTPAWTAQNPTINYYVDGYVDPGMPEDVTQARVRYEALELNSGRGLGGVLRLRINKMLKHVPTGRQVPPGGWRPIRFRASRPLDIYLPVTDDPDLVADDGDPWVYEAVLTVRGYEQNFEFALPSTDLDVNLADLIP